MKRIFLPLCLLAWSAGSDLSAQSAKSPVSPGLLLKSGKEMFEVRNWDGCIDRLSLYKSETADKRAHEEADYMLAVAAFEKNKDYALEQLIRYYKAYPASSHRDEVGFLIGTSYFLQGEYAEALIWFDGVGMDRLPLHLQPAFFQRMGVAYLKTGDTGQAYPLFSVLASMDSEYRHSAQYYLAYLEYADKKYANALSLFEALPPSDEYAATAPFYIAQINFILGKYDKALIQAKELLAGSVDQEQKAELNRIAAMSLYEKGMSAGALPYFKRYFELGTSPLVSSAFTGGVCAYEQGDTELAVYALSRAAAPNDEMGQRAYLYLGHAYLAKGDIRNAKMAFERASDLQFNEQVREEALFNYGLTVHESSYSPFNESVVVFEDFLNRYPNSAYTDKVNDCLFEVYMTTRNYEAALGSINKISRPGQKLLTAKQRILFQLGTQQVANARLDEAEKYFTEAIQLGNLNKETRAQAFFWRGECAYRNARYPQAESDFRQFLTLSGNTGNEIYSLGRYNLGYACFKQQKFAAAIEWFDKYLSVPAEHGKNTYVDALNRLGDSHFYLRRFGIAEDYYTKAAGSAGGSGDYAMFQKGFMAGLQKNYTAKVNAMKQLRKNYPQSEYADDALFEEGKTYVTLQKPAEAIACFNELTAGFPNSSLSRQAGLQLGLLYFNGNQPERSIQAYKQVIDRFPGSEEARVAAEDLKAVYIDLNDIPAYAAYINTLKGKVQFAAGEQDSLTYLAAERVLARGNAAQSKQALTNYLQSFDQGAFRLNAQTEIGRIYFAEKDYPQALIAYEAILQQPDNKFTEEALARTGEIYFKDGEARKALITYRTLADRAERKENKDAARIGILRSTVVLELNDEVVLAANDLLQNGNLSPDLRNEALYNRAKSLLALNKNEYAVKDLKELAKDTRTAYGAEASYLLAQTYFNSKELAKAEKEVFALIDSATPHQYWLARGFILLSDIYITKGDSFQAKQYLQSLQSNYTGNDDIAGMIESRFKKLEE
ncbi:MAG: tetratricopeptide repeat protein [Bacteroidales bacterium]